MRAVICVLGLGLMLGCSGGGRSPIPGNQCSADYQPIKRQIEPVNKVALSPDSGGHLAIAPGKYQYQLSDFYYVDAESTPAQNYRVHIRDAWDDKLKTFKATVACARNAKVGLAQKNLSVHTRGINALTIDQDQKLSVGDLGVRNYGFAIEDDGTMTLNFAPSAEKLADPSKIADGAYIFVHPENANIIEVRSEGQSANGGHWILSNKFVRTDAP